MDKTLKDLIIEKGKVEEASILNEAKNEAKELYQQLINEAENKINKQKKKAFDELDQKLNLRILDSNRSLKEESSKVKQDLISELFNNLKDYLNNLKDNELFSYVLNKIKSVKIDGDEVIAVSNNDYNKYLKILSTKKGNLVDCDLLNEKLGNKSSIKLTKEPTNINNGFILMGKIFDYNFSFDEIIEALSKKYEKKIYEELK